MPHFTGRLLEGEYVISKKVAGEIPEGPEGALAHDGTIAIPLATAELVALLGRPLRLQTDDGESFDMLLTKIRAPGDQEFHIAESPVT